MIIFIVATILIIGSVSATDTDNSQETIQDTSSNLINTLTKTTNTDTTTSTNSASSSSEKTSTNNITTNTLSEDETKTNTTSTTKSISKTSTSNVKTSSSTRMTVNSITANSYDKIELKATIASGSKYVNGGTVAFKINGQTVGHANVKNGKASYVYQLPGYSSGTYTITGVYGGTNTYSSETATNNLKISKSTTTITVKSVSGEKNSKVRILAVVKASSGSYVYGGYVVFKLNGLTIGKSKVTNGGAAINYTIPSSLSKSSYTITAIYGETKSSYSSTASSTLKVYPKTTTKITVNDVSSTAGSKVTLTATVKSSNGTSANGGKVVFKLNGVTIGSATVSSGKASISYSIPSSYSKSSYTITAIYSGNGLFKSNQTTAKLKLVTTDSSVTSEYAKYLVATKNCQVNNAVIKNLAKTITAGKTTALAKAKAIFSYLNDKTSYTYYLNTRKGALSTWNSRCGNCVDLTHILVAVSRAAGIPARYVHGANCVFRSGLVVGHVWGELYVGGTWYKCDISSNYNSFGTIVNWNRCGAINRYISLPF